MTISAISPLSQEGRYPNPDYHPDLTAASKPSPSGENLPPRSASAFPLDNEGTAVGIKEGGNETSGDGSQASHDNVSLSTLSTMSVPGGEGGAEGGGSMARGRTHAHGGGGVGGCSGGGAGSVGSSSKSLTVFATVRTAASTFVSNTIDRKHGRTTNGAVTLKVAARGIEPRLALDKKTHAFLEGDISPAAACGVDGASGSSGKEGRGRQFLKFEAWSTRVSASSSPWSVHPSMRRQASERLFARWSGHNSTAHTSRCSRG